MFKICFSILIISLYTGTAIPQISETEFFDRVDKVYYTLDKTDLKNFSVWVSSVTFDKLLDDLQQEKFFPLDFIWVSPDKMFFIKRALPSITDTTAFQALERSQLGVQKELRAILIDWQRFYGSNPLSQLPPDYTFSQQQDTVLISFQTLEQGREIYTRMYFGVNGRCLKIITRIKDSDEIIYTYPEYRMLRDKKLCKGWMVQIQKKGEIQSGFTVSISPGSFENYIIPRKIIMQLQSREADGQLFQREYIFRNVRINRDLQIMN